VRVAMQQMQSDLHKIETFGCYVNNTRGWHDAEDPFVKPTAGKTRRHCAEILNGTDICNDLMRRTGRWRFD
jgi:hypothetical protein